MSKLLVIWEIMYFTKIAKNIDMDFCQTLKNCNLEIRDQGLANVLSSQLLLLQMEMFIEFLKILLQPYKN